MNLKLTLDRLKATNPGARITQGTISSDVLLSGSSQVINWNVKDNKSNPTVNDVLLRQSDAFCVTAMSIQVRRVIQAGAVATPAEIAQGRLYTYANPVVFPTTEARFLQTIYNGNLVVTINKNRFTLNSLQDYLNTFLLYSKDRFLQLLQAQLLIQFLVMRKNHLLMDLAHYGLQSTFKVLGTLVSR